MRTVFTNAKVYVEKGVYAEAVLVEGNKIAAVGTNDEIGALVKDGDNVIDCGGKTLIPGFNDTHMHVITFASVLNQAPIDGVRSIDDMVARCRKFAEEHPAAVEKGMKAIGWNQDLFEGEKRLPNRHDLDKISTEYPIVLVRVCEHIAAVNTCALEQVGYMRQDVEQIPGGVIEIGEDGYPTGVFKEAATRISDSAVPDFTLEDYHRIVKDANKYFVEHGVTSVQSNDIGGGIGGGILSDYEAGYNMFREMAAKGELQIRYRSQNSCPNPETFKKVIAEGKFKDTEDRDALFHVGPLKLFRDGSLGGRTAILKHGYLDDPTNHGADWFTKEAIEEFSKIANENGIQVVCHVIGDQAVTDVVNAYADHMDKGNPYRNALIHVQVTDQETLDKIVDNDILCFVQPIFIDYDMSVVYDLCGPELAETSYNFGWLGRQGVHVSYGTDCPVEICNPFRNIYTAITRKGVDISPNQVYLEKERVDRETAVDNYTYESAYGEFMEDIKGRIKPGYLADIVVMDKDIFTCEEDEIKDILPVITMVDGKIVYAK